MALRDYPAKVLLASSLSSFLILSLCAAAAGILVWEQARTADILGENIDSRRAAAQLEEDVAALAILHQRGASDVAPVHERAEVHLAEAERFADKPEERRLVQEIADRYHEYLDLWAKAQTRPEVRARLLRVLQEEALPASQRLQAFNARQIDESEQEHRAALRRMAWGVVGVGALGSVAGLVLGYGLARGLRLTIHQFLVRVQGAADLVGPEPATVEWQRNGAPLDGGEDLLHRVEQAVSRLQQREREVRRAERLAALGQLAAGVAHEIRNPLSSALLLFQTARRDPSAGGLTEEDRELIEQELQRIDQSLQAFLDFARPPKLARANCDLVDVVREALALTRARAELQEVKVAFEPQGPAPLHADAQQLRQVVLNLVLNALDAMPHGGRLGLHLRNDAATRSIELSVTDTGAGIAPQVLPRLFEPFASGKETGIGLGLVVARRIIEEHGGTVHGTNRAEGGAIFTITLPTKANVGAPSV
jgi:two-component system sensor histidine kinase HydH